MRKSGFSTELAAWLDRINMALGYFTGVVVLSIMLLVSFQVAARYIFHANFIWINETSEFALLFLVFLPAAWVLKERGHVRLDLLLSHMSKKSVNRLELLTSIIGGLVCLILTWYSAKSTLSAFIEGSTFFKILAVPKGPIMMVVPFGFFMLFVQFARDVNAKLGSGKTGGAKEASVPDKP